MLPRAAPECGTFGRISHTALGEYHTFATITKTATPYTGETRKHNMIIAGAGDWTKSLIKNPPEYMWVRRIDNALFDRERAIKVAAAERIRPGRTPFLSAVLPAGQYVATAWSKTHGLWSSSPFTIGHDRMEAAFS